MVHYAEELSIIDEFVASETVSFVEKGSDVVTSIFAPFAEDFLPDTSIDGEQFKNSCDTGMPKISGTMCGFSHACSGEIPGT